MIFVPVPEEALQNQCSLLSHSAKSLGHGLVSAQKRMGKFAKRISFQTDLSGPSTQSIIRRRYRSHDVTLT